MRATVFGLTVLVLAVCVAVTALRPGPKGTDTDPTSHDPTAPTAARLPPAPNEPLPRLRGSVDLLVYRTHEGAPVLLPLGAEAAMPLRTGDEFRIDAEVSRPAFLYLFWIDETGQTVPMYPWVEFRWGTRPAEEAPVRELKLTAPGGVAFQIDGDADGMETILMLARATKLDADDAQIRGWFAGLKPLPFVGPRARVWFDNFDVLRNDEKRGVKYDGDVSRVDGPRELQLTLKQRIGPVNLARAISFARVGKKGASP